MTHPVVHPMFKWIWKNPCQPKHKVFFWLLLKDRLGTRNILRRKCMVIDSYNCVLCNLSTEEVSDHLFLNSQFARQCWNILGISIANNSSFPEIVPSLRNNLQPKFFMVAIILMCWSMWSDRNDLIFNGIQANIQNCRRKFLEEIRLVQHRVKQSLQTDFHAWILSLNLDI